jgi:periplasmic divalent cation tolerance protein
VTGYLQVCTLTGDRDDASMLAYSAVRARLAASAQLILAPASVYWYRYEVGEAEEWQVVFQTTAELYGRLEAHLLERHPRDNPDVWAIELAAAPAHYLQRIADETAEAAEAAQAAAESGAG